MVGGDWIDYVHDLCRVIYEYRPKSMLELGCGALLGARAAFSYGTIKNYLGIDWRANLGMVYPFREIWPSIRIRLIKADIHNMDEVRGEFDCALIDAHQGSIGQHGLDHGKQIEIVDQLKIPLVIADDCRIESIATAHLVKWGEPTGRGAGVTGLWWWKR